MIDPERWARIEDLFEQASALPASARGAFLERECGSDLDLHRYVETLIAPMVGIEGTRIGPYRVLRELGQGGMGTVYLAERADGEYEGQVAIKVTRDGPGNAERLRRLRTERQILANLRHPNIAGLLDGGTTDDGAPYVVMEYVEGTRIDLYCDAHRLDVRARIELVRTLAGAVEHANRNLVVHRDIKPGNILVTGDGIPKLLDFGIAKLLDAEADPDVTRTTTTRILTPAYASPEQIAGDAITTASDVYSLGVVCYVILIGRLPYQLGDARTPSEVVRIVSEAPVTRPSDAVTTGQAEELAEQRGTTAEQLRRIFAGDLDAILLTALRKEPDRRYRSAGDFGADLGRFLDGRPVSARPDTLGYRAGKFVARNRIGVAAAAAATIALIAAVSFYTARLARERDRAQVEAAKAGQVAAFLEDLFEVSDPSQSRTDTITARELLDRGAERIATNLTEQPEVQATLMGVIGRVYRGLGMYPAARDQATAALAIRRRLHAGEHHDVAESETDLGAALGGMAERTAAEARLREALRIERALHAGDDEHLVAALAGVAAVVKDEGTRLDDAEALFREALAMRERLGTNDGSLAMLSDGLAGTLVWKGDYAGAEPWLRQSVALVQKQVPVDSAVLAIAVHNLGHNLKQLGKAEEAITMERQALAIGLAFYGPAHPYVTAFRNGLGTVLRDQGDLEGAAEQFRRSLTADSARLGPDHDQVATNLGLLGTTLLAQGRLNEAEVALRGALGVRRKALGPDHPYVAISVNELAGLYLARGKLVEAESRYREALALRRRHQPAHPPYIAYSLVGLARTLISARRPGEAIPLLLEADTIRRAALPEGHRLRVEVDSLLGIARPGG
jgi:tetratricopeptide (TPR) repeat protein/predicted Ser/Thr protein kinase